MRFSATRRLATLIRDAPKSFDWVRASLVFALATLLIIAIVMTRDGANLSLALGFALQVVAIGCAFFAARTIAAQLRTLGKLAELDPATGCLNRRGFARALEGAVGTTSDVALLALDLDHFKRINDQYGHSAGDAVLSEVAATLAAEAGSSGIVSRLGGEEFAVLLPGADAETAGEMAEHMLAALRRQRFTSIEASTRVTMSIGIAAERIASPRDGAALRARADEALYVAKRGGRDRVLLWAPGVRSNATPVAAAAPIVHRTQRPAPFQML